MVYMEITPGVYIQDSENKLYTIESWDSTKTLNGIAIISEEHSFVVGIEFQRMYNKPGSYKELPSSVIKGTLEEAILDYNGVGNTQLLLQAGGFGYEMAKFATEYIFPNGKSGYIMASGELYLIHLNKNRFYEALDMFTVQYYRMASSTFKRVEESYTETWTYAKIDDNITPSNTLNVNESYFPCCTLN